MDSGLLSKLRTVAADVLSATDSQLDPKSISALSGACAAVQRLLAVQARYPDRLRIETHALAVRAGYRRTRQQSGIWCSIYLKGEAPTELHAQPSPNSGERRVVRASQEVILAGGAFNTPQLLMLSGIGPRDALAPHGIAVRTELNGVGRNLQDRYEVSVVNRTAKRWSVFENGQFNASDPLYQQCGGWARDG